MAVNVGKRRLLLQARAEGKTLADAAREAGMSTRQAERLSTDPTFRAELQQRLDELDREDQQALLQHRRRVLAVAGHALAQQLDLMGSNAPAVVRERAARAVQEHLVRLFPQAMDVAVVGAQLDESGSEPRSVEELFGIPEGADKADVIDTGREVYQRLKARREAVQAEFPPAEGPERPGLQLIPSDPEPIMDTGVHLSDNMRARLEELQIKGASRTYEEDQELERLLDIADPMRVYRSSNGAGRG
jgi:hypothetical protein